MKFWQIARIVIDDFVLPRMREWIEISNVRSGSGGFGVLPRMREWIEMGLVVERRETERSSLSYEGVD